MKPPMDGRSAESVSEQVHDWRGKQSKVIGSVSTVLRRFFNSRAALGIAVFLLALCVRMPGLDVFVGPDETSWVTRSANFGQALTSGDWTGTYQTGHPGVIVMWVGTLGEGLRQDVEHLVVPSPKDTEPDRDSTMTALVRSRQTIALVNAALVAVSALLVFKLFGGSVAWLSGILLAMDPFLLTEARALRTEGLMTSFSFIAVLCLMLYVKQHQMRFSIAAGVLTGLAILSKVSALVLLPVAAVAMLVPLFLTDEERVQEKAKRTAYALVAYGGALLITAVILWPALWVEPMGVLGKMYDYVTLRAVEGGGGGKGTFFLGTPSDYIDLPLSFYPVVLLFRTTPCVWLGLLLTGFFIWRSHRLSPRLKLGLAVGLVYLALYLILIAKSGLKMDRYTVPMLPLLDLMASVGFVIGWDWLTTRWASLRRWDLAAVGLVLVCALLFTVPFHPYYYTYWNPLLGGASRAVDVLPVGVGYEGIEQVADYLNSLPVAEELTVASANSGKMKPVFTGKTVAITNLDGHWYLADYTFIYISQLQRGKHDDEIIKYLAGKPLVFTARIDGMDYGWLYLGPNAQYFGGDTKLEGRATLHAYDLSASELAAGTPLTVTTYFRNEGQLPTDRFFVRLVGSYDYVWVDASVRPRAGFADAFTYANAIVEGEAVLQLPTGMNPGRYILKMGFEDTVTGQLIGRFVLPTDSDSILVTLPGDYQALPAPQPKTPVTWSVGDELGLQGYTLEPVTTVAGSPVWLTLYWRALQDVDHDYIIGLSLLDAAGHEATYWLGRPVGSTRPTDQWLRLQPVQDPWRLDLPPELAAGDYSLSLTVYDAATTQKAGQLALGQLSVIDRP